MGQFSWIYSDTDEPMIDGKCKKSYLLVPTDFVSEFGGYHIEEDCYDGYGRFGNYDVYDLVAYWNKNWILENPDYATHSGEVLKDTSWYECVVKAKDINNFEEFKETIETLMDIMVSDTFPELRSIGIAIACYDEDNGAIENPIKIVESSNLTFNQAYPSLSDPNQGWEYDDDFEEDEDLWTIDDYEDDDDYDWEG